MTKYTASSTECDELKSHENTKLKARWDYIKADPEGARALLLLLHSGKGTLEDFDTMVDRIIESRKVRLND